MITVDKDGTIHKDETLDSSLCGLFQFGMFSPEEREMGLTMQKLEQALVRGKYHRLQQNAH
jgi:hypothetical protein